MINENTIKNMKKQVKVNNALIEQTKNNISKKHKRFYLKPFLSLATLGMVVAIVLTIIGINNNNNNKSLSINPLIVTVYAMDDSSYYLTANYEKEASKQILKPNVKIKLAKYNKAMSSVPGIPITFGFDYDNQNEIDYIKININNGEILNWNVATGFITNLGNEYKFSNNETLYFSPSNNTIITLVGIKNNKEIFTMNIKITTDNEYNYYATIDE